ncbi:MAG: DNA mismatch endonuclease Vsr [Pseudomonadota bacterium]
MVQETSAHDTFSRAKRSQVMRAVKSQNTKPELLLRKALHARGLRYTLHRSDLPGKPDIVLPKYKTVLFVHGCFWHGHDCKRGARVPKTNTDYWLAKINRNRARDDLNRNALQALNWRVFTVWECALKDLSNTADFLSDAIRSAEI